jgi:hypothetical protein
MHFPSRSPRSSVLIAAIWQMGFYIALPAAAQTPAAGKPQPDVLILVDDERLVGHFAGSTGTSLTFKSDILGDVTADWSKVKELQTQGQYVVLPKNLQLRPHMDISNLPQGTLEATDKTITIMRAGAAPRTVPVAEADKVLEQATFQQQVEPPHIGITQAWTGTITAGASVVEATQQSTSFTGAVSLIRAIPVETDFPPRNRTIFDFSGSEGHVIQPGTPKIKTEIAHADAERDEYLASSAVYAFGKAAFDHNYSQGLQIQQDYGGGIGWTVIRQANETLDLKGSVNYVQQQFQGAEDQNLIASTFGESLLRKFSRGATFTQTLTVTPTWNNTNAWLAFGSAAINLPVYKRLNFTLGVTDNYLHDPAPNFKKNSLQATTGLTYSLK